MSQQNYDPVGQNDQSSWVQSVNPQERSAWAPQQGGQMREETWSPSQARQSQPGQDPLDKPLDTLRQQVESQMHEAIDHYANRLPGGSMFAGAAKQAVSGILDSLERQADSTIDSRLENVPGVGGLIGGNRNNEGGQL